MKRNLIQYFWGFAIALIFTGCFTMQDRMVVVSEIGVSTLTANRAELSDALDLVNQIAIDNGLKLKAEQQAPNLVAFYSGRKVGFFNGGSVYIAIHQNPNTHTLIITTSDSPSYSRATAVNRIHRETYKQLRTRFGEKRVTQITKTMGDPGWFE